MTDEQLAHRLGLVVLDSSRPCTDTLFLKAAAPPTDRLCITSTDLRTKENKKPSLAGENPIPLVMLGPGEKICLECKIEKKNGRHHTRHSPVNVVTYRHNETVGSTDLGVEVTGALGEKKIIEQACRELLLRLRRARAQLA
jgi:DNA-directed RNA polymerase alpha subunit